MLFAHHWGNGGFGLINNGQTSLASLYGKVNGDTNQRHHYGDGHKGV
jgi:hypothetical protein